MLKNCKEEDFYELKCVAEDRMRPDAIPVFYEGCSNNKLTIYFLNGNSYKNQ